MKMNEFEVGKKYRHNGGQIATCVGKGSTGLPIFEVKPGVKSFFVPTIAENWEEYHEPKTGVTYVNIYLKARVAGYPTRDLANQYGTSDRIACVKVNWVEGQFDA